MIHPRIAERRRQVAKDKLSKGELPELNWREILSGEYARSPLPSGDGWREYHQPAPMSDRIPADDDAPAPTEAETDDGKEDGDDET